MNKSALTKRVLLYEAIGFGLVAAVPWADEILNLPHRLFGVPGTVRWQEALFESLVILGLCAAALLWMRRALAEIRHLEGFLRVCSFCKRVHRDDQWVPIEQYVAEHSEAVFSHGLCPDCVAKHYPEFKAAVGTRSTNAG
jgi:hypothetical protein